MAEKKKGTRVAPKGKTGGSSKRHDRELIDTGHDKRYVRRDEKGRFSEVDDVGRSLAQDVRKHAKTGVKSGQGDRGDRRRGDATASELTRRAWEKTYSNRGHVRKAS
ncbi:MAG TPA: hypothetical protein VF546_05420 [Pyrinomonadaceae bacterium]|jgi:hypothetical protein